VVRDLDISNKGKDPIDGINGVLVEVKNYGTAKDITLDSLSIHDVYGILVRENLGGGNAILLRNKLADDTVSRPSRFDGLLVQNCTIRNCQRNGAFLLLFRRFPVQRKFRVLKITFAFYRSPVYRVKAYPFHPSQRILQYRCRETRQ